MTMQHVPDVARAIVLVRAQYQEMPGLSLTIAQGARLVGTDRALMGEALRLLERERYLVRTWSGRFVRRDTTLLPDRTDGTMVGNGLSGLQPA